MDQNARIGVKDLINDAHLFETLLRELWWVIPIFLLIFLVKIPFFKGIFGEWIVNLAARTMLDSDVYHLIRNVTLPAGDGTTQIDHIIVSRHGVFVIETKNMRGLIFGGVKQKTWTQLIYKKTYQFQSPLHQNYKHTKTLESLLGLDAYKVFPVVVFVGDSTFKTPMPENVTYGSGFIQYIKSKRKIVLTQDDVKQIVQKIESGRLAPTLKTHREHKKHANGIVELKAAAKACPRCGSVMVLRVFKEGMHVGKQFWGCSTYPKCKAALEVTGEATPEPEFSRSIFR